MSPPAYLATRGAVGLTNLVQMAFAENVHGMELPDPVMRGIFNTCMPIIFKDLPYGMDFAKFRRSWRFYLIWVLTNFATCDGEINGNGQFLMVHTRSPWWKSVGSRYERHGLAAMRHDDVDGAHRRRRCSPSRISPQMAPCRRNPEGAGVFGPQALSFVGHEDYASFRSSFRACDPNTPARDSTDFHHGLLDAGRSLSNPHPS